MFLVPEIKTKEERKIQKKQEFKFLGSGRYHKGSFLWAFDYEKNNLYKVDLNKKQTIKFDQVLRKDTANYKAIINPEHYHFWAFNKKTAQNIVRKLKKRLVKNIKNSAMSNQDKVKQLELLIDKELQTAIDCNKFENVCNLIKTETGKERITEKVKSMILFDGYDDIEAALVQIENEFFMNE